LDRIDHPRDRLGSLTAVAIEKDGNANIHGQRAKPCEASSSIAAPGFIDHVGSGITRHSSRRVCRAVVHHDHLGDRVARRSANEIADHGGLVQRPYDQDCLHPALTPTRKLGSQPTPWSFTTAAIASGATSKSLAHIGIVHGSERKKL